MRNEILAEHPSKLIDDVEELAIHPAVSGVGERLLAGCLRELFAHPNQDPIPFLYIDKSGTPIVHKNPNFGLLEILKREIEAEGVWETQFKKLITVDSEIHLPDQWETDSESKVDCVIFSQTRHEGRLALPIEVKMGFKGAGERWSDFLRMTLGAKAIVRLKKNQKNSKILVGKMPAFLAQATMDEEVVAPLLGGLEIQHSPSLRGTPCDSWALCVRNPKFLQSNLKSYWNHAWLNKKNLIIFDFLDIMKAMKRIDKTDAIFNGIVAGICTAFTYEQVFNETILGVPQKYPAKVANTPPTQTAASIKP